MPDLVHQIGELFLRAVPVALIVLVFYFVLRSLFFQPLLKVMAERDARTLGAQKVRRSGASGRRRKSKQYEEALKQARAKVYAEQEAERKKLLDERAGVSERSAGQGVCGSQRRQRARRTRICGGKKRDRKPPRRNWPRKLRVACCRSPRPRAAPRERHDECSRLSNSARGAIAVVLAFVLCCACPRR